MTAIELLARARRAGIVLRAENGRLAYDATRAPLDADLRAAIAAQRDALLALVIEAAGARDAWRTQAIEAAPPDVPAPLSLAQERLWFLEQFEPGGHAYHVAALFELRGELDTAALERALCGLLARHRVLDARLSDGELVAVDAPLALDHAVIADEAAAAAAVDAYRRRPFALDRERPLRALVVARGEAHAWLAVVLHHIACDGVSLALLTRELGLLYRAEQRGDAAALAPLPCQYGDYARWQRATLDQHAAAQDYWRDALADAPRLHALPLDRERPAAAELAGAKLRLPFPPGLAERAAAFGRTSRATTFHVLHAAFAALLARFGAGDDLLIGTPVAGRVRPELESLVGLFVNTVVLRTRLGDDPDFATLVARGRDTQLAALEHQELPFERVLDLLGVERSSRHAPLFQLMFALRHDADVALDLDGVAARALPLADDVAKHELTLEVLIGADGMSAAWEYNTALFDTATIARLAALYFEALDAMLAAPERPALAWPLPPDLLAFDDRRDEATPADACVLAAIARQDHAAPALDVDGERLSYGDLDRLAHGYANALRERVAGSARVVALCLPRSRDWYASLLGAWRAGCAVVPLDPAWPAARMQAIVSDSGAGVVVTTAAWRDRFAPETALIVEQGDFAASVPATCDAFAADAPAYLVYTSGSTGTPKGVVVAHGPLAAHTATIVQTLALTAADRVLHLTNLAVDTTFEHMLAAWSCGACVVAHADELLEPARLLEHIAEQRVTVVDLAPAYANEVAAATDAAAWRRTALRCVVVGGDVLPASLARRWLALGLDAYCALVNAYGPTEAVITSHTQRVARGDGAVPLGRVLPGRCAAVLDARGRVAPLRVPGELALGGVLADGYHGLPALTAERYAPLAHAARTPMRAYRTGDRVQLMPGGELRYLGRGDHQVKLRGYRIELEEIERCLCALPGVVAAAAEIVGEDAARRLVAWLETGATDDDAWRHALAAQLPAPMVPAQFVALARLPRNAAGKVDRRALPLPPAMAEAALVAPRNDAERALCDVWADVLQRSMVGIHDNFFRLGGDSIRSLQVIARLRERGYAVTPKLMFQHQTVAELAVHATAIRATAALPPLVGDVPLAPIQRWFFDTAREPDRYHQQLALRLKRPVDAGHLAQVWDALWQRHDLLRARFVRDAHGWRQQVAAPAAAAPLVAIDVRGRADIDAAFAALQAATPLAGPLAALAHVRDDDGERLLVCAHHLIVDGVSWRVLLGDLFDGLAALARGDTWTPSPRTATYAGYVDALAAASDGFDAAYWHALAQETPAPLPQDRTVALADARQRHVGRRSQRIERALTADLVERAGAAYRCRVDELLLIALARALAAQIEQQRLLLDRERHGRDVLADIDTASVLGWFTAVHPLPLTVGGGVLADDIASLKEQLRVVDKRGLEYPSLHAAGRVPALVAGQVLFNYHGIVDAGAHPAFELDTRELASGNGADNPPGALVEINARVVDGGLDLAWLYAGEAYDAATIARWSDAFAAELAALVAHCLEPGQGRLTRSDLPQARFTVDEFDRIAARDDARCIARAFALTPLQRGLLVETLRRDGRDPYYQQTVAELDGAVDAIALASSWRDTVAQQPMLRTAIVWEGVSEPHQMVLDAADAAWQALDWSALDPAQQDAALDRWLADDQARSVDLARPPLARMCLIDRGNGRWWLVWGIHHLIVDGWSTPLLVSELFARYRAAARGDALALPAAPGFDEYVAWRERQDLPAQRAWWREQLAGYAGASPLPAPPTRGDARREECELALTPADSERVRAFCREHGCTVSELVSLAWGVANARYGNSDDVVIGVTRAGRPADLPGVEATVGVFINTLPLRLTIDPARDARQWLAALREQSVGIAANEAVALADIVHDSGLPADRLFGSLLVVENFPALASADLPFRLHVRETRAANHYALTLRVSDREALRFEALLDASRVDRDAVAAMLADTAACLLRVIDEPACRVGDLLGARGVAPAPMPASTETAQALLWQQPSDAVAVRDGDTSRTYGDLRDAAGRLAGTLASIGVDATAPVALCLPRTFAQLVAMAAAWHRGAAWLPLDPAHPPARQHAVLADSGARVVIGAGPAPDWLPESVQWIDADAAHDRAEPPRVAVSYESPAYLIYTSGSTGTPKGVVVSHGNLAHYVAGVLPVLDLSADAVLATLSTVAADLGFTAIFGALLSGRCLRLLPAELSFDTQALSEHLHKYPVDSLKIVPSHLAGLLAAGAGAAILPRQCLVTGGEALTGTLVRTLRELAQDLRIVNHYGPTETTVGILTQSVPQDWPAEQGVPVGMPLAGNEAWVLDRYGLPAPIGVAGELLLGGGNLSLGYWRRDAETAERFVPHPFAPGRTLYRSGDRAKRDAHGRIVYLGRADQQVKIRGHRVELGEVEAVLAQLHRVEVAAVLAIPGANGALQLAACVQGTLDGVADALAQRLPEALCPSRWRSVDAMPRLGNGKIDRQALAALLQQVEESAANDDADTHPVLRELWETLLGRSGIGAHENFFALGGDSILSLQVVARARQAGLALTPQLLFDHPTLAGLSAQLIAAAPAVAAATDDDGEPFGLTPIQHWFFEQPLAEPQHWNMSVCVRLREPFDATAFAAALADVAAAHPMLRATFAASRQRIAAWHADRFAHRVAGADERAALFAQWQAGLSFDGPMLRVLAVTDPADAATHLLFATHHLVVDAVSWRIVLDDLRQAYAARRGGTVAALAPVPVSFRQWQRHLADLPAATLARWRAHWSALDMPATPCLPWRDSANRYADAATVHCVLDRAATSRLVADTSRAYGNDVQDVLLAALALATGQASLAVELEGHGRDADLDLSRTVGWFTARYPLVLRVPASREPGSALRAVKDALRAIPDRGVGYGVLRYLHSELAHVATPDLCFNYLGRVQAEGDGAWTLVDAGGGRAPANRRRHRLDVNAALIDGELRVDWTWPADAIDRDAIDALAARYVATLRLLIDHLAHTPARPTLADAPLASLDAAQFDALVAAYPTLDDAYPLAPLQQGLMFHSLLNADADPYVNQTTVAIDGPLDRDAFARAWQHVVDRHAILRSGFVVRGLATARQVVWKQAVLPVRQEEWHDVDAARLAALQASERDAGFDLATPPLMRLCVLRIAPSPPSSLGGEGWGEGATPESASSSRREGLVSAARHLVIWTRHHLALDGWSSSLLLAEVMQTYAALRDGRAPPQEPAPRFRDFLGWLAAQDIDASRTFWRNELDGIDEAPALPEATRAGDGHASVARTLDASRALAWAQAHGLTANTLVQGALALVLRRYYGRDDVVLGITTAGRPADLPGVERMLGVFINSLPLRVNVPAHGVTAAWFADVQRRNAALRAHEHLPLADMQRLAADAGALFDVLLVFENVPGSTMADHGLRIAELDHRAHSNYPLMLTVLPDGARLRVEASVDTRRVDAWLVEQLLGDLADVLEHLPDVERFEAAPPLPSQALQAAWTSRIALADDVSLVARFADVARRFPDRVALTADDGALTYARLDVASAQLAARLIAHGAGPGERVGLCLPRGCDLLVALLAILRCGAAYVPIDMHAPAARRALILSDSAVCLTVTCESLAQELPGALVCVDVDETVAPIELPAVPADAPAYLIYTSGSTGTPKGVVVTHRNVARLFAASTQGERFAFDERDVWTLFHSHAFDFAVWELWGAWLYGGRAVLVPEAVCRQPDVFLDLLARERVTVLNQTPSAFYALQSQLAHVPAAPALALRTIVFGGEALEPSRLQPWRARYPEVELINMYGITETTVHVSFHRLTDADLRSAASRIGRALPDLSVRVLDRRGEPAPVGVIGELVVAGDGVATGYWQRPELTRERFPCVDGERRYRSGDLARWLPDGTLEYRGRADDQVKLRGYRIELGEIAAKIAALPGVIDAAVIVDGAGDHASLLGYAVAAQGSAPDIPVPEPAALRDSLRASLPDYMVPRDIVVLAALPLTVNGKLDRRALPKPASATRDDGVLATAGEARLAALWHDLLGGDLPGRNAHFFARGGHSLLVVQLAEAIRAAFGVAVPLKSLFELPRLADQAALVDALAAPADASDATLESFTL